MPEAGKFSVGDYVSIPGRVVKTDYVGQRLDRCVKVETKTGTQEWFRADDLIREQIPCRHDARVARCLSCTDAASSARVPRSWSLPSPPPEDVTGASEWVEQWMQAFSDGVGKSLESVGAAAQEWVEQQRRAVVGGEPPRFERDSEVARLFHDTYERLAPQMGYRTREASAVPWDEVPQANRDLMIATVHEVRAALAAAPADVTGRRCPSCGNPFDGDNLCMPSACQWEGTEEEPARSVSPDDAHTETVVVRGRVTNVGDDTTSTLRHTEWLTIGTDEDGNEGAETFEAELDAVAAATRWRIRGMTNVYVERHDVSTTRTVTLWEAQR